MELMTVLDNANQLSNVALKEEFSTIKTALLNIGKTNWTLVKAWSKILNEKLYVDDFKTTNKKGETVPMSEAQLAKAIGISSGLFAQYKGADRFLKAQNKFNEYNITMMKAYMLNGLIDERRSKKGDEIVYILDDFNEFIEWSESQGLAVNTMSDKDLKDLLKAYLKPIEETEEPKTSEEPEDSQEPKTSEEDNNSEDIETLSAFDTIVSMLPQLTNEERKALKKML